MAFFCFQHIFLPCSYEKFYPFSSPAVSSPAVSSPAVSFPAVSFPADFPSMRLVSDFYTTHQACIEALRKKQPVCLTLPESLSHGVIGPALFFYMTQKATERALKEYNVQKEEDFFIPLYPCGTRAGDVLAALKTGIRSIAYQGEGFNALLEITHSYKAQLYPYEEWLQRVKQL